MTDGAAPPPAAPPPGPSPATPKPLLRRWSVRILLVLVVLGVAGLLLKNVLVRKGLEEAVTDATGFPLEIDSFDLGLFDARIDVKGLRLSNPPGFADPRCLHVRRLLADVELASVLGKDLHVERIDLDVEEIVVVKDAQGLSNLERLEALGKGDEGKAPAGEEPAGPKARKRDRKWRCDLLRLRLGRVVVVDYGRMKQGRPKEDVYELGVDEEIRNVHSAKKIVRILVRKVLTNSPVTLLQATADSLSDGLGGSIGDKAKDALGGILGGEPKIEPPPAPKPERKKKR